jgi:hypothetical protein
VSETLKRTIPVEGGEVTINTVKRWRTASVWLNLSRSPYRLSREQQDTFRSLASWLISAEVVHALNIPKKEADSLADYFEGFVREHLLSKPPIDGADLEEAKRDPFDEMPKAGEFFMAYKVAGYIIDEGYSLSRAIKQTTSDVDAGKKCVPQWAVTRVARWIATGNPERPDDLPYYMIEEREALEACLLELVDLDNP